MANPPAPARKRLALFFDGTWNTPESNTNVWELYQLVSDTGADGVPQVKFYDRGAGTHWYDRLSGGAFGAGLPENVRQGYAWLMNNYTPGDEVFLFGFSRGDAVRPIYGLLYLQRHGETHLDPEEQTLLQHTFYHRNLIKMVGVWDTVGSIGLPDGRRLSTSGLICRCSAAASDMPIIGRPTCRNGPGAKALIWERSSPSGKSFPSSPVRWSRRASRGKSKV
jgi:uncharacterized protein (DUF2235 family)